MWAEKSSSDGKNVCCSHAIWQFAYIYASIQTKRLTRRWQRWRRKRTEESQEYTPICRADRVRFTASVTGHSCHFCTVRFAYIFMHAVSLISFSRLKTCEFSAAPKLRLFIFFLNFHAVTQSQRQWREQKSANANFIVHCFSVFSARSRLCHSFSITLISSTCMLDAVLLNIFFYRFSSHAQPKCKVMRLLLLVAISSPAESKTLNVSSIATKYEWNPKIIWLETKSTDSTHSPDWSEWIWLQFGIIEVNIVEQCHELCIRLSFVVCVACNIIYHLNVTWDERRSTTKVNEMTMTTMAGLDGNR